MGALDTIRSEVLSWDGVSARPHRFGGIEFRYGNTGSSVMSTATAQAAPPGTAPSSASKMAC